MKKTQTRVLLQDRRVRYRVLLESEPCEPGSAMARVEQFHMLDTLVNTQEMAYCGPCLYQTLTMAHNGSCWVVTMESVVKEQ